ncbi:hypothetical protein [Brasilonema bromeliae]|uniref:hypothetical protein n=1 Tax=Brasilonema bromeliae TaxID=383615 RepID=UPI00145D0DEC|nr:hypothetical protein [Brasilonema bromeliae]
MTAQEQEYRYSLILSSTYFYNKAKLYVQQSEVVGADETSFNQRNIDGCNRF